MEDERSNSGNHRKRDAIQLTHIADLFGFIESSPAILCALLHRLSHTLEDTCLNNTFPPQTPNPAITPHHLEPDPLRLSIALAFWVLCM